MVIARVQQQSGYQDLISQGDSFRIGVLAHV